MKSKTTCPKCGSVRIIRQVQVIDRSDSGAQSLSLRRGTRALGGWLKLPRIFPLDAWACGACGFTELYVREPTELLAADDAASGAAARTGGSPAGAPVSQSDQTRTVIVLALLAGLVLALGALAAVAVALAR
jgi:predicted nucleic-acid-binding Zn-ribbon protein